MQAEYKSGFVTLIGRSNVGKSTLVNAMVGEKVAIVSDRPQTTRNQIRGVLHRPDYQIVFIDTPGLHKPHNKLGQYMVRSAGAALDDVDVALAVMDASVPVGGGDRAVMERLATLKKRTPVILVLNKIDLVPKSALLQTIDTFRQYDFITDIVPISARTFEGVDILEELIAKHLKPGPKYFPEDMYTDQPERVIVSEIIREKALTCLRDEIPHGIGVEVVQMKTRENDMIDIHTDIIVERENHKGIVVGKKGEMLKKIGSRARADIEALLGNSVNLQLWVKTRDNWRDSVNVLRDLGYDEKNDI